MKKVDHLIQRYDMTVDQENTMALTHLYFQRKLRIWDENGEMVCWCDQCRRIEPISKTTLREVQAAQICPMCFREIRGTTRESDVISHIYVEVPQEEDSAGFRVDYYFSKGNMEELSSRQVAYWSKSGAEYVFGITMNTGMSLILTPEKNYWRYVKPSSYYGYALNQKYRACMFNYQRYFMQAQDEDNRAYEVFASKKKDFYKWMTAGEPYLKTNQEAILRDGIYNQQQIRYIRAFDLKTRAQILRASAYIKRHYIDIMPQRFTPATLEYLRKHNIRLSDYVDYADACTAIGRKVDRPSDFKHWHDEITKAAEKAVEEQTAIKIKSRAQSVGEYEKEGILIAAIGSVTELTRIGQKLHNCIRTYAERYAEGKCDLYCMLDADEIVGAIEVRNGRVIQAREDKNTGMTPKHMKALKDWAEARRITV